jgi:hypothetical protein
MKSRERVALALAAVMSLVALSVLVWRVQRGIDFTDEAFHVALPMRFALGDRPFVDELNLAQTAGLLIYPLVKLHMLVRGTTGIFLFLRIVYVVFFFGVALCVFRLARTKLPTHAALLAAAAYLPFIPYGSPALSYNTLGCGLLTAGLCVTTRALLARDEAPTLLRDPFYWGGLLLGASAFAYPTLVSSAVIAAAAVFLLARGNRIRSTIRTALGGVTFALIVSPVFLRAGGHAIREMLAYSTGIMTLSTSKAPILWRAFLGQHPELVMTFGGVAIALALSRRWPVAAALLVPVVPFLARETSVTGILTSLGFVASVALLAPLFALALRDSRFGITLLVGVWLPSMSAGAALAWSSGNGAVAAGVGLYPAAIVGVVLMTTWIFELTRTIPLGTVRLVFGFAPVVHLYVMTKLLAADDAVYRDASVPELTARITEGPYKGLLTSPSRRASLVATSRTILSLATSRRTVFYYDFPAGYLITQTRPVVPSAWMFAIEPRMSTDARVFSERAQPGDVVFHLGATLNPANPLDRAVSSRASPLGYHDAFSVWVVR